MELTILSKSRPPTTVRWTGRRLRIGRRVDVEIRVDEPTMSGLHAELIPTAVGVELRDLESLNGTYLNGVRITEAVVRPGDRIQVGGVRIEVGEADDDASAVHAVEESRDDDTGISTQTIRVRLDSLRDEQAESLREDERLLLLRDLFESLRACDEPQEVTAAIRPILARAFVGARIFILEPGAAGAWHDPHSAADGRPPSLTFVGQAVGSASAILSGSLSHDERFAVSESARISGIATAVAAPVYSQERPVAVLYADRLGLPPFGQRDLNVLGIAANHVSAVLDNVARMGELRRANEELHEARDHLAELARSLESKVEARTSEIRRQSEEIRSLAAAKDELIGIAAHDIRGPLTVIQGTSELLQLRLGQSSEGSDPTLVNSLRLIHGAASGLSSLLSELLDAKAIETGKIHLRRQPIAVRELLERSLPAARLAAAEKRIELAIETDEQLAVEVDPRRLGQALTNLALNAVKFSASGTRIALRARAAPGDTVAIEVEDQGIGIPEEELERIFGSFEQGAAGKAIGGSGLGLVIARRLVELHDGHLAVKSKVGVGTRFILTLPRVEVPAPVESA